MGIRRLKQLLTIICGDKGIRHHPSVSSFLQEDKKRIYNEICKKNNLCNPIKQMAIRQKINMTPYFVGIDANLFLVRYSRNLKNVEKGFLKQILLTLSARMIPIYVFDGYAPEQKKNMVNNRRNRQRKNKEKLDELLISKGISKEKLECLNTEELIAHIEEIYKNEYKNCHGADVSVLEEYNEVIKLCQKSVNLKKNDIENLKNFFDKLKIPYITANNEADDMLAFLYKNNIIQACQSDDMDMLPKGCGNVIQINQQGVTQFLLKDILEQMNLTNQQFIDLCVLLGSDYYISYLPKMDPIQLYNYFKSLTNPSLESFVESYTNVDPNITPHLEHYIKARESFSLSLKESLEKMPKIELTPINSDRIIEYFIDNKIDIDKLNINKMRSSLKNVNSIIVSWATKSG